MSKTISTRSKDDRGFSLIELIITLAIMAVLIGILAPMFIKYVDRSRKSRDVYTADQIARAINIAFVENPDAYEAFQKWKTYDCNVSVMEQGTKKSYKVYRVAASGQQRDGNQKSNCFNGTTSALSGGDKLGNKGFYGAINRELGLSTTEVNSAIIPQYTTPKEGSLPSGVSSYGELDRWRIVKRADNGMMEIWASQPNPGGGYPIYRVWPIPDDIYRQ